MEKTNRYGRRRRIALAVAAVVSACGTAGRAGNLYWDINGNTSGAGGSTPSGTWSSSDSNWNANINGTGGIGTWVGGETAIFAAGNDASGTYAVTVSGTQTIGGLTLEEGALTLSGGTLSLNSGVSIDIASSSSALIQSELSGGFGFTKTGSGLLSLGGGTNSYTGATSIGDGTLAVSADGNLGSGGGISFAGGGMSINGSFTSSRTITLNSSASIAAGNGFTTTFSGPVVGSGGLTKTGVGTLVLSGGNTYSGGTTISAGTLQVFANGSLGGGGVTIDGGTLATAGNFTTTRIFTMGAGGGTFAPAAPTSLTVNSALAANANSLTKAGTGDLVLTTSSARTGATTITSGGLRVNDGSALGSGGITVNGTGALRLAGVSVGQNLSLTGNGMIQGFSSTSTYAGTVTVDTGATPTLSSGIVNTLVVGDGANDYTGGSGATTSVIGTGVVILPFANNYQGNWSVSGGGTLQIPADDVLGGGGGTISFNTGALALTASISSARNITLNAGGGTLSMASSTSTTWSGVIGGTGGLTKTGDGILVLNGANTYSGGTTVNAGTLLMNSSSPIGSGTLTLGNTAVLKGNNSGSTITLANAVSLPSGTADINIPFGGGTDLVFNGVISGSGGLRITADGNGRWMWLNGANSFSGGITLDGTSNTRPGLRIGNSQALGTGTFTSTITASDTGTRAGRLTIEAADLNIANAMSIGSGARLTVNTTGAADIHNTTFSGVISGAGALQKLNDGILTLEADNTFTGGVLISGGTLKLGAGGTSGSVASDITNNAALTFDRSNDLTWAGVISGTGTVSKAGVGTLTITGANSYTGMTTVDGGVLQLNSSGSGNAMGGDLTVNSGGTAKWIANYQLGANKNITVNSSGTLNLNGLLQTVNNFTVNSIGVQAGGLLTVDGTYNIGGNFTVPLDIQLNGNFAYTAASGIPTHSGNLVLGGSSTTFNINDGTSGQDLIISGVISGNSSIVKSGAGLMQMSNTMTFGGAGKTITVTGGQFSVGSDGGMGNAANTVILDGGTLRASSSFVAARDISLGSAGGAFDVPSSRIMTVSGVISGVGSLTKVGTPGTLRLTGTNTYTGGTVISQGTLTTNSDANLGGAAGAVSIDNGSVLRAVGSYSTGRALSVGTGGGNIDVNGSNSLTWSGLIIGSASTLTKVGTGTLVLSNASPFDGVMNVSTGTLLTTSGAFMPATITGSANVQISASTVSDSYSGSIVGAGSLTLEYVSTAGAITTVLMTGGSAMTGQVNVKATGLQLSGAGGVFTNASAINVGRGAGLFLNNSGTNRDNRVGGSTSINLNGSLLRLTGNSAAATNEITDTLSLQTGGTNFVFVTTSGQNFTLTPASLGRAIGATALIRGATVGGQGAIMLGSAPGMLGGSGASGTPTVSILPGVFVDTINSTGGGTRSMFATYDASAGIRKLSSSEFATSITSGSSTLNNVAPTAVQTVTADTTINSLKIGGPSDGTVLVGVPVNIGSGKTLTLSSGSILFNATTANAISGGTLAFGSGGSGEAIINVQASTGSTSASSLRIDSTISASSLTKEGSNELILGGTNSFTGTTYINRGRLTVTQDGQLGTTGVVVGNSGWGPGFASAFDFSGSLQLTNNVSYALPLTIGGGTSSVVGATAIGALDSGSGGNTWSGNITITGQAQNAGDRLLNTISAQSSSTLTLTGLIGSSFMTSANFTGLLYGGNGVVVVGGSSPNTYKGITRQFGGTVVIEKNGAFGTTNQADVTESFIQLGTTANTVAFRGGINYTDQEWIFTNGSSGSDVVAGSTTLGLGNLGVLASVGGVNRFAGHVGFGNAGAGSTIGVNRITVTQDSLELAGMLANQGTGSRVIEKQGAGELILSGNSQASVTNNFASAFPNGSTFKVADGTVTLRSSNASGGNLSANITNIIVGGEGRLTLDNSLAVNLGRLSPNAQLTVNGGELKVIGNASSSLSFTIPSLELSGDSKITMSQPGGGNTATLTFTSIGRANRGTALFRGLDGTGGFVNNTGAGVGGGGSAGSPTINILPELIGDASATGVGTDFVTANGGIVRLLAGSEYTALSDGNSTSVNATATGSTSLSNDTTVNSIKVTGSGTSIGISNGKTLTLTSGAILDVSGGSTTISGGALNFGTNEGVFHVASGGAVQVTSAIGGSNAITKAGPGLLKLQANNSYTGTTMVHAGVLEVSSDANLGSTSANVWLSGGALRPSSSFTLDIGRTLLVPELHTGTIDSPTGVGLTFDGSIGGAGTLAKFGSGTLSIGFSANNFSGTYSVNAGTLALTHSGAVGGASSSVNLNGGMLRLAANGTYPRALVLNSSSSNVSVDSGLAATFSGVISGSADLVLAGPGTFNPTATNLYTGRTVVNSGALLAYTTATGFAALPPSAVADHFVLSGGTLRVVGQSSGGVSSIPSQRGITLSSNSTIDVQQGTSGDSPYTMTIAGVITGSAGLNKTGAGTLIFDGTSASNTFTGTTNVNEGILSLSRFGLTSMAGNAVINNTGTLRTTWAEQIANTSTVTVNTGGALEIVGQVETIGALAGSGTVTMGVGNLTVGANNASTSFTGTISGFDAVFTKAGSGTFTLSGTQNWTSSATLSATGGTLALNSSTGNKVASLAANGGNIVLGASQSVTTVTAQAASTVILAADGSRVLDADSLVIIGFPNVWAGKVDLNDNAMIVRYSGLSPLEQVRNQVKTGLNAASGYWDGNGITSSMAAADGSHLTAVAVAEAADVLQLSGGDTALFFGQTVDATTVLLKYTMFGDTDFDGDIDGDDFFAFDEAVDNPSLTGWYHGDFNYDGVVDRDNDFAILIDSYQSTLGGAPIPAQVQAVIDKVMSVPEPSGAAGLMVAAGALLRRRRPPNGEKGVTR